MPGFTLKFHRPAISGSLTDAELSLIDAETLNALDLIEVRIDHFDNISEGYVSGMLKRVREFGKPVIATVRAEAEGGNRFIEESERLRLITTASRYADILDVEAGAIIFDEAKTVIKNAERLLMASYHNFEGTEDYMKLSHYAEDFRRRGADIVKIATSTASDEDIRTMTRLTLDHSDKGIVTICMGGKGLITRVFFPFIGSLFTFASIGLSKAPGQISVIRLRKLMDTF